MQLLERVDVVGYALIAGGIFFLYVDKIFHKNEEQPDQTVTYPSAVKIGFFQTICHDTRCVPISCDDHWRINAKTE